MYVYITPEDTDNIIGNSTNTQFIELLKSKWDSIDDKKDVLRYKINKLQERTVGDKYLLLLNEDRNVKRRAPERIVDICQPFDDNKFNFTKVPPNEVLFNMTKDSDVHSVLVNVSPISKYHTLLCPSVSKRLPQIVTENSIVVALDIMFLAHNRDLKIGFNSLCGLASVNHLHYHLFFVDSFTLPVEKVKCRHIKGPLYTIENYPVPAFCFKIDRQNKVNIVSNNVLTLITYFIENSIAHNVLIAPDVPGDNETTGFRIIVWPRKSSFGAKQLAEFNIAVCELSGWLAIYDKTAFENLTADAIENEFRRWKIDDFDLLCEKVKCLF